MNRIKSVVVALSFLATLGAEIAVGDHAVTWRAATARVVITPEEPMCLVGFGDCVAPAQGTAHDRFAKAALAIEGASDDGLVDVTPDLLTCRRPCACFVADYPAKWHHLHAAGLLLNCSHTHCGRELRYDDDELAELSPERAEHCRRYT